MPEKTAEQVLVTTGIDGRLARAYPTDWFRKVRAMRRDPTLGFLRDMFMAPIIASEWTVVASESKYEDAIDEIYDALVPLRRKFLRDAIRGLLDFGWQPYETVLGYTKQGTVTVRKLKPLLQDLSWVLVDEYGRLRGVRNMPTYLSTMKRPAEMTGPWLDLTLEESLVIYRDVEGTNWYGEALMRRVEKPYDAWNDCEDAATRYDKKIAGAHWVVHYPMGSSRYAGAETDNFTIANKILDALQSSGRVAVPRKLAQWVDEMNSTLDESHMAWRIELISASGSSESHFVGRQRYQDSLKARGMGLPERSVLEGQYGTKAEAEAHADFAIDNIEMMHTEVVTLLNEGVTNHLLRLNHGEPYVDQVRVQAMPIQDFKRAIIRSMYSDYFRTEQGQAEEIDAIDWPAIREQLGVPTLTDEQDHETIDDDDDQPGIIDDEEEQSNGHDRLSRLPFPVR